MISCTCEGCTNINGRAGIPSQYQYESDKRETRVVILFSKRAHHVTMTMTRGKGASGRFFFQ